MRWQHEFPTTHWSLVIEAGAASDAKRVALGELLRTYLPPLRAYLGPAIKKHESTFPFIVVFPQSQKGTWNASSEDGQRTMAILPWAALP